MKMVKYLNGGVEIYLVAIDGLLKTSINMENKTEKFDDLETFKKMLKDNYGFEDLTFKHGGYQPFSHIMTSDRVEIWIDPPCEKHDGSVAAYYKCKEMNEVADDGIMDELFTLGGSPFLKLKFIRTAEELDQLLYHFLPFRYFKKYKKAPRVYKKEQREKEERLSKAIEAAMNEEEAHED